MIPQALLGASVHCQPTENLEMLNQRRGRVSAATQLMIKEFASKEGLRHRPFPIDGSRCNLEYLSRLFDS
jgi:hypothetical protein